MFITRIYQLMVLFLCSISFYAGAETKDQIQIWSEQSGMNDPTCEERIKPSKRKKDNHIRITDVGTPSMQYFPVSGCTKPTPSIILCPGGAYKYLVVSKMTMIAEWLNEQGISVFLLKYRTPKKREGAFQDLQRAVRIVRSRAAEWNIDPNRIGILGSSAGGHLAARVSAGFGIETYKEIDAMDRVSCRPDFTILLYPAYMNEGKALKPEFTVSKELAPTLIISARDDMYFPGSLVYEKALEDVGASVRVHFFDKGGHGFTLRPRNKELATWPDLCLKWLRDIDMLKNRQKTDGGDHG